jgi:hypothetical protein
MWAFTHVQVGFRQFRQWVNKKRIHILMGKYWTSWARAGRDASPLGHSLSLQLKVDVVLGQDVCGSGCRRSSVHVDREEGG